MNRKGSKHVNFRLGNSAVALTEIQYEVLEGELLGDGCIRTHATPHAHCSARWRLKRREHAAYLAGVFDSFAPRLNFYSDAWELQLQTNPTWDSVRSRWYPIGKKAVPADVLLTKTSCFHWYIGDGCLDRPNRKKRTLRVNLAAMGFGSDGVEFLRQKLSGLGFCFHISKELVLRTARHARDFLEWIRPVRPIECYAYKWGNQIERTMFDVEVA